MSDVRWYAVCTFPSLSPPPFTMASGKWPVIRKLERRRRFSVFIAEGRRLQNDAQVLSSSSCLLLLSHTTPASFQSSLLYHLPIISLTFLCLLRHLDWPSKIRAVVLCCDHVRKVLQFPFVYSGYQFSVYADLVQHGLIGSVLCPTDSQHTSVICHLESFQLANVVCFEIPWFTAVQCDWPY